MRLLRRVSPTLFSYSPLSGGRTLPSFLVALSTAAILLLLLSFQHDHLHPPRLQPQPSPPAPPPPTPLADEPPKLRIDLPVPATSTVAPQESRKQQPLADADEPPKVRIDHPVPATSTVAPQAPRKQQRRRQPSAAAEALARAKREIENAPPLPPRHPDLHTPLFRNVSVFKRSYELMEEMLKVYVYREGASPIFHRPPIKGIYASEGWFMKLMESSRQFATKDADKALLFYLPYSVHRLQLALYRPESPNRDELSFFIRDYVNTIASKYPFWNRTRGSDHFIVACHDWGPYTTREHNELLRNSIKALCNADVSEGIFVPGRDVSLPETIISTPRRPLRDMGGAPVSQRTILAFYAGRMHGRVRPVLLKHWGNRDSDMRIYGLLPSNVSKRMSYADHMKSSKFCICPMGYEVNSPRIVEAIYYECVPVIIADNFVLPFDQVLDWSAFSIVVAEEDIPKLKDILLQVSPAQYNSMHANVVKLQRHFLWHAKPVKYDIFHMILHSIWFSRVNSVVLSQ